MQLNVKTSCALILVNFLAFSTCQSPDDSDEAVALMTTVEPIDGEGSVSFKNASYRVGAGGNASCMNITECSTCHLRDCNWVHCDDAVEGPHCTDSIKESCSPMPCTVDLCTNSTTCQDCMVNSANCTWVNCGGSSLPYCSSDIAELCQEVDCDAANVTTTAPDPSNNTTTTAPDNNSTTTETSTATTMITTTIPETTTTTDSPTETTTTTDEPVTPTPTPATMPTTSSTTSAPPPAPATGGFSAGSFFGGITLTLALLAVGYGGFRFYKTRYDVNYRTL